MSTKRRIDLVVCLLVAGTAMAIGWWYYRNWLNNRNMGIGPKWEIIMADRPSDDSLHHRLEQIRKEREAMDDYFAVHNVTDEGFDLIAQHDNQLQQEQIRLKSLLQTDSTRRIVGRRFIPETKRPMIAVRIKGGYWKAGRYHFGPLNGPAVWRDPQGRIVCGLWDNDTIVVARRYSDEGCYDGQMDTLGLASGQGRIVRQDGSSYTGMWVNDHPEGWGFESSSHGIKAGEWRKGRFLGEKIKYTSERIYGIDISRHQHEKGRKRFTINWRQVRITSLGPKHNNMSWVVLISPFPLFISKLLKASPSAIAIMLLTANRHDDRASVLEHTILCHSKPQQKDRHAIFCGMHNFAGATSRLFSMSNLLMLR